MYIDKSSKSTLLKFRQNPADQRIQTEVNRMYWDAIYKLVRESAGAGKASRLDLSAHALLFDCGILDFDLIDGGRKQAESFIAENKSVPDKNIYTFSEWLAREYQRALSFDKKDELRQEIKLLDSQIYRKWDEIKEFQNERRSFFSSKLDGLSGKGRMYANPLAVMDRFYQIENAEQLFYDISVAQKEIAGGKFLDISAKRELVQKNTEQQKLKTAFSNLLNETMDYLRELVTLSSKRVHAMSLSVTALISVPATKMSVKTVLEKISEFDPKVFKNERVKYMGMPNFVIVPGYGKSLYDWKNNAIIIPSLSYGKLDESIFYGVIEYKLDADEDKVLLMEYNKIEENKGIKSHLRLKEKFSKDYVVYMSQETRGYKVLPKDTRVFFNREISPVRYEIKMPLEYDPVAMSQEAFVDLKQQLQTHVKSGQGSAEHFYGMGIIDGYYEAYDAAIENMKQALTLQPDFLDALYNLGIVYMKKHMRKEAAQCFTMYIQKTPQSWWTSVCQEYLTKLR